MMVVNPFTISWFQWNKQMIDNALFAPVTNLKGVGTKTAADLGSLGIYSIYDLLFYFPFRYDELQTLPLDQIMDGQKQC